MKKICLTLCHPPCLLPPFNLLWQKVSSLRDKVAIHHLTPMFNVLNGGENRKMGNLKKEVAL